MIERMIDQMMAPTHPLMMTLDFLFVRNMNLYKGSKIAQSLIHAVQLAYVHGPALTPTHFIPIDMLHYEGVVC